MLDRLYIFLSIDSFTPFLNWTKTYSLASVDLPIGSEWIGVIILLAFSCWAVIYFFPKIAIEFIGEIVSFFSAFSQFKKASPIYKKTLVLSFIKSTFAFLIAIIFLLLSWGFYPFPLIPVASVVISLLLFKDYLSFGRRIYTMIIIVLGILLYSYAIIVMIFHLGEFDPFIYALEYVTVMIFLYLGD